MRFPQLFSITATNKIIPTGGSLAPPASGCLPFRRCLCSGSRGRWQKLGRSTLQKGSVFGSDKGEMLGFSSKNVVFSLQLRCDFLSLVTCIGGMALSGTMIPPLSTDVLTLLVFAKKVELGILQLLSCTGKPL